MWEVARFNLVAVPDMTYNVFAGTLSLTQSINQLSCEVRCSTSSQPDKNLYVCLCVMLELEASKLTEPNINTAQLNCIKSRAPIVAI